MRGATPAERAPIADLYATCFSGPHRPYERMHALQTRHAPARPGFRDENARVAVLDGRIVSHVQVIPYTMHYGQATLTVGGVGNVCTHPDHRGRGYSAAVMRDAIAYMRAIGCDISLLNGIAGYYPQFGYANVWPYHNLDVNPRDLAGLTTTLTVRDLSRDDIPAMLALYEQAWRGRPGARCRDSAYLAWALDWFDTPKVAAVDAEDRLRGYMVDFWVPGAICEVVAEDADTTAALLLASAASVEAAYGDGDDTQPFRWFIPPDATAARHARRLCTVEIIARVRRDGGWMGRIIDLHSTIEKLLPELEARVQGSPCVGWEGRLLIETDLGAVTLAFSRGALALDRGNARPSATARLSQRDLAQLMFAFLTPAEVAAQVGAFIDAPALRLLEALFPPRVCDIAGLDWF